MLGDCLYCDEPLTNELRSVACDDCSEGFHVACADEAGELSITVDSRLLRSDTYAIDCPNCGHNWSVGFDPRE